MRDTATKIGLRLDVTGLFLAGLINTFLAMLDAGLVLGPGMTMGEPDLANRSLWIADNSLRWRAGWLFWFAVTLSFSWSYYALGRHLRGARPWINLAIGLAVIAAAIDIVGVLINLIVLPGLSEAYATQGSDILLVIFQTQESLANALTTAAAFDLYTLAGLLLLPACFATPDYPRKLVWLGVAEWGIAAIATVLLVLMPDIATVPLLISFFLYAPWIWGGAWWLLRRDRQDEEALLL